MNVAAETFLCHSQYPERPVAFHPEKHPASLTDLVLQDNGYRTPVLQMQADIAWDSYDAGFAVRDTSTGSCTKLRYYEMVRRVLIFRASVVSQRTQCTLGYFEIMNTSPISDFIDKHFLHFNAAALVDAAKAYKAHKAAGGKMMVTLAGAMSTAELGISLAEMIRTGMVDIISCTGANLEEDIMNLVAHTHYKRVPNYRDLSPNDEWELLSKGYNRVTDTCIPEEEAFRRIQRHVYRRWQDARDKGERFFPHEYMYQMLLNGDMREHYEIDPAHSWMIAAAEMNIPIIVPGWEDSTMGNIFASYCIKGVLEPSLVKSGIEYMVFLSDWYRKNSSGQGAGFFQIGGGIAGDFPICVVPMMYQDLEWHDVPFWAYFCQISDSTTSYGSYSGAVPNEKITWGKLGVETPRFVIESDATIVAPLMFAYILGL